MNNNYEKFNLMGEVISKRRSIVSKARCSFTMDTAKLVFAVFHIATIYQRNYLFILMHVQTFYHRSDTFN